MSEVPLHRQLSCNAAGLPARGARWKAEGSPDEGLREGANGRLILKVTYRGTSLIRNSPPPLGPPYDSRKDHPLVLDSPSVGSLHFISAYHFIRAHLRGASFGTRLSGV